ncbi:hypothetical protein [Algihabitans albus]|uniref:hypothetical protein n=1 Tax=Algihabitans albus TaxID=2164067 RepID=UPI0013C2F558|nr:hypothetical protein [Algihabitans albus]
MPLTAAECTQRDRDNLDLTATLGLAVRKSSLLAGFCDYLPFVQGKVAWVVGAKKSSVPPSGVAEKPEKYNHRLIECTRTHEFKTKAD